MLFIPQIAAKIYNLLDTTMLGAIISDKKENGYYEQSQKVIRLLLTIVTSLGTVMVPRMANTFATGNKKQINKYIKNSFNFVFIISFPMMFGISIVSDAFVPIFFGDGYEKSALLIKIFSPMLILMGIENVIGTQYLLPTKRQKEYTIAVLSGIVANVILNTIFINLWASVGASIATVFSQLVVDGVQIYFVKKDINWKPLIRLAIRYFIASFAMFIVCLIINIFLKSGFISIIIKCVVGASVYLGLLILFKDKFLNTILEKVKSKFVDMKLRFQN
jgi:O-antigen/teichoic acid export membrane protein